MEHDKKDENIKEEEVEQEEVKPDKPVEQSQFNKYRDAYLREHLRNLNVKDDEMDASIKFIDERTDDTDSNLDEVMHDLRVRMRLEERRGYIDPTSLGGGSGLPRKKDNTEIGRKAAKNLINRGKVKL